MIKSLTYRFFAIAMLLCALGCSRELRDEGRGCLELSIGTQAPELVLKSSVAAPASMGFAVQIKGTDGKHNYIVADSRIMEPLTVAAGVYDITATSLPGQASAWGEPIYSGTARVTVRPERINSARITCKLANAMVSAEFDETIVASFSEYSLSIEAGGTPLVLSNSAGTAADTAYFAAGDTLHYSVTMTTPGGASYSRGPLAIALKGGTHYRFKISTKDGEGFYLAILLNGDTVYNVDSEEAERTHTKELSLLIGDTPQQNAMFASTRGIASLAICHSDAALSLLGMPEWTDLVSSQDISALQAAGFSCAPVPFGSKDIQSIDFSAFLARLGAGSYSFRIILTDIANFSNEVIYHISVVPPVESRAVAAKPWAKFAVISGEWLTAAKPAGLRFQYKVASASAWTDITSGIRTDETNRIISADIYGLQPGTKYFFRTVTDSDLANGKEFPEISFTTDSRVPTVPNLNFDSWYQSGSVWYPNESGRSDWDTANKGTADYGAVPTTPESSDVVSGKAARLESATAGMLGINKFAAGNIYLGQFGKIDGMGAILNWGYPFAGRPVALRGWYKYRPVNIDYAESPYTGLKGTPDGCAIRVFLCDWSSQFVINTNKGIFLQEDDPSVIANKSIYSHSTDAAYKSFVIPIEYHDNRTPTYIEIVGSASRYGDYFTGGKGSVLLLDEFELVYDAGELSEDERIAVGYRNL